MKNESYPQQPEQVPAPQFPAQDLYLGHFTQEARATLQGGERATCRLYGELFLAARREGSAFQPYGLQRLALFGPRLSSQQDGPDDIRILSLGGPSPTQPVEIKDKSISNVDLRLHYAALSEKDFLRPQFERMIVDNLSWEGSEPIEQGAVKLSGLNLQTRLDLASSVAGRVEGLVIDPFDLNLWPMGSPSAVQAPKNSLPGWCAVSLNPQGQRHERRLLLQFINLTAQEDITRLCTDQISPPQTASQIWAWKGALNLVMSPNTFNDLSEDGQVLRANPEQSLPDLQHPGVTQVVDLSLYNEQYDAGLCALLAGNSLKDKAGGGIPTTAFYVNVCVVERMSYFDANQNKTYSNGVTLNPGAASAVIILAKNKMGNSRLFAHELCHVIGISHPGGTGAWVGSPGSIAAPPSGPGQATPSPDRNPIHNLEIFLDSSLCNPAIKDTTHQADWWPDP